MEAWLDMAGRISVSWLLGIKRPFSRENSSMGVFAKFSTMKGISDPRG